jgi:hypothetical protein
VLARGLHAPDLGPPHKNDRDAATQDSVPSQSQRKIAIPGEYFDRFLVGLSRVESQISDYTVRIILFHSEVQSSLGGTAH